MKHEGLQYLRTVLESFEVQNQSEKHLCLVHAPMRETLSTFQRRIAEGCIPSDLLKPLLRFPLIGLDYLHTICHIINTGICVFFLRLEANSSVTDLKPENVLLGIEDDGIINGMVQNEQTHPTPAKFCDDRWTCSHCNFGIFRGPK